MNLEKINASEDNVIPPSELLMVGPDDDQLSLPLIPVRGMGVFPGMVLHFDVNRPKSMAALEAAMEANQVVFLAEQKNPETESPEIDDLYDAGCVTRIKQMLKMPGHAARVLVEVVARGAIEAYLQTDPYFAVQFHYLVSEFEMTQESEALQTLVKSTFVRYMQETHKLPNDFDEALSMSDDPDHLIDLICSNLTLDLSAAQEILRETNGEQRLMLVYRTLVSDLSMIQIERGITEKVRDEIDKNQREYILREQIKVLQDELNGGEAGEDLIDQYRRRVADKNLSEEVQAKAENEISRLEKIQEGSPEAGVIQDYLDWILDLPWNDASEDRIDVSVARKILNQDHYALDKVKERILEYISVLQLTGTMKAPILCLVGPPGVGKTSIAKSIARALGRKYVRMSLGGVGDEAEIRGHRRTYVGAIPGRILYNLKQAGTNNPLFLLDEIDKISQNFRGDPASALLEVLDPEQNSTFTDHYLELPFDLSHVLFLTTANSLSTIPRPLLDRMEVIEVNGYVEEEKQEIARRYLVPKQLEAHGLTKQQVSMSKGAIKDIVNYYTRESGVRELEREIAKVCRVAARDIVENHKDKIAVSVRNLETFLGSHRYSYEKIQKGTIIGLVNGLAWTAVGGVTLEIEVLAVDGSGKTMITGKLGDVMQESIKAAMGFIRSRAEALGIQPDFFAKKDIHLHVPEGAVPKDGPSAGITMATALISALTGRPVPQNLAMTGEITLLGRVLPIGGLREKLTAAHRAGITEVIIPEENQKDLEEVPDSVLSALDIHPVGKMDEVIDLVFGAAQ